jgi:hypothetical protein
MGRVASGVKIWAGSLGEIGDKIAIGCFIHFGSLGFVPDDDMWILASANLVISTIVPFGSHEVFIGYVSAESDSHEIGYQQRRV